jgi:hypothetical protein
MEAGGAVRFQRTATMRFDGLGPGFARGGGGDFAGSELVPAKLLTITCYSHGARKITEKKSKNPESSVDRRR